MTPKQILDLLTTPEGREELRILAAEADGWRNIMRQPYGGNYIRVGKRNDIPSYAENFPLGAGWGALIPDIFTENSSLIEAERRLGLHDRANVSLRVRYTQYLHELVALQPDTPVNNAGTPVVSDLDKYFAPTELKCCAYVLTAQWKQKQPTPETK